MENMMNNPQLMALMQDPEIMSIMQRPGTLERLKSMQQNHQNIHQYMNDPDFATLLSRFQGAMGGMGGGMGSTSNYGASSGSDFRSSAVT